ncbi:MAG: hypothetical protein HC890_19135 [Chloroflexaceae bacterium]|nr:hypothetical protein [Chloroflexaceae bacterium]
MRLIPIANTSSIQDTLPKIDEATLEAMVAQVLAAKWDVQLDDEDC